MPGLVFDLYKGCIATQLYFFKGSKRMPANTSSWDDVCIKYVNPVLANQHAVLGFVVLFCGGSWVFFVVLFLVTFVGR